MVGKALSNIRLDEYYLFNDTTRDLLKTYEIGDINVLYTHSKRDNSIICVIIWFLMDSGNGDIKEKMLLIDVIEPDTVNENQLRKVNIISSLTEGILNKNELRAMAQNNSPRINSSWKSDKVKELNDFLEIVYNT